MELTINKKHSTESITLTLAETASVEDLIHALYDLRTKTHQHLSFGEYQKKIVIYQYSLYGDTFKVALSAEKNLADYSLENATLVCDDSLLNPAIYPAMFWKATFNSRVDSENDDKPQTTLNG